MRIERLPAARGRTWVIDGFRLLRRAPLALLALSFLYLLILMLTTVVPLIGPFAPMLAELAIALPFPLIFERTGSQMKAASISPRSQAAAISGGRRFITLTLFASSPSIFMAAIS